MSRSTTLNAVVLVAFVVVSQLAGLIGSIFTVRAIPGWYATLVKPSFNPPSWVFAPVWTALYTMMGIAAWLVSRRGLSTPGVKAALTLFAIQLVLNAAWSVIFFGAQDILLAAIEIVALWVAILFTTIWFFRVSTAAGMLMVPYLLWVSFASVLNFALLRLNN